jgi:hypothetical protein
MRAQQSYAYWQDDRERNSSATNAPKTLVASSTSSRSSCGTPDTAGQTRCVLMNAFACIEEVGGFFVHRTQLSIKMVGVRPIFFFGVLEPKKSLCGARKTKIKTRTLPSVKRSFYAICPCNGGRRSSFSLPQPFVRPPSFFAASYDRERGEEVKKKKC